MTQAMMGAMIEAGGPDGLVTTPLGGFGDFGFMLLRTIAILVGVCILSYLVIRFVLRRFVVTAAPQTKGMNRLALLDRMALDTRRSLAVVKAGQRVILVGLGEGQIALLCELDPQDWPDKPVQQSSSRFHDRLRAALGRTRSASPSPREDRIPLDPDGRPEVVNKDEALDEDGEIRT